MTEPQSIDGLTAAQAAQRLLKNGPNALPAPRPLSVGRLLLDVVAEPMFFLLVACGVIYLLLGARNEALMLLGFVCIVMGITFFSAGARNALRPLLSTRPGDTRRQAGAHRWPGAGAGRPGAAGRGRSRAR